VLPNNLQNVKSAIDMPAVATHGKEQLLACRQCGLVKLAGASAWVPVATIPHGTEDDPGRYYAVLFVTSCDATHPKP